ncbi:hypothetical protein MBM_06620 [Drepanopeziza brunnea f. sp. 'multigermtubi' MB_m1]|uniref:Uncharacterized protein n=1 Tax=Marssonina brunnea f. sp. multigermtubi (strain MB_m1) TaxID=1072389 RepID=K1XS49_MARBU|nr:uncharacterized protein MBM_06620 [Drepanopeziza brunnea f. sp. 'multigermtubi' MB_m1]EKD15404.1 hypothetical protein MBM_06620 [Drepanopeziza brunnea f. sp. 'multigermtubi' MB_m1]
MDSEVNYLTIPTVRNGGLGERYLGTHREARDHQRKRPRESQKKGAILSKGPELATRISRDAIRPESSWTETPTILERPFQNQQKTDTTTLPYRPTQAILLADLLFDNKGGRETADVLESEGWNFRTLTAIGAQEEEERERDVD